MELTIPRPPDIVERSDTFIGADNIVYCAKCKKPLQKLVKLNREMHPIRIPCDCEKAEQEETRRKHMEEQALSAQKEQQQKTTEHINALRYEAFPDQRLRGWTFDADDGANQASVSVAKKYVDSFDKMYSRGVGLLLYGGVGTGKTFLSACIANALIDNEHTCFMTNFSRLSNTLMGMFEGKQEYIDKLCGYELLIIDDLSSERDTEYMGEVVNQVIDSRYRAETPLIVTTNLTADELKHPKDIRKERIYSRLFEMCIPYEVKGIDRRKKKLRDHNEDLRELLGIKKG